jgi:hypothetical protein
MHAMAWEREETKPVRACVLVEQPERQCMMQDRYRKSGILANGKGVLGKARVSLAQQLIINNNLPSD